jgi:hypothetical protein
VIPLSRNDESLRAHRLPSLDQKLNDLIEMLQQRKLRIELDADSLGEQLYGQLYDQIRELGATAANEAITGWL